MYVGKAEGACSNEVQVEVKGAGRKVTMAGEDNQRRGKGKERRVKPGDFFLGRGVQDRRCRLQRRRPLVRPVEV